MKAKVKIDPRKLPTPPYPPTKTVRTIKKPDIPYEVKDYDAKKLAERRKRACANTRKNGYSVEQETLIIELYKQGIPHGEIAKKIGKTETAVKQRIAKLRKTQKFNREAPLQRQYIKRKPENEIIRRNHYTPAQDAVIRDMKADGKTYKEIADQIGKSPDAVRGRWRRIEGYV